MAEVITPAIPFRMADGTVKQWNPSTEQKPDTIGNNASRNGFAFNPGTGKHGQPGHPLGRFFQETIKKGILAVIRRIHDKEIPRYDKTPYVYDDPRLANLDHLLKAGFTVHLNDNDAERKREIAESATDIIIFLMKEDIYYRFTILKAIQDIAKDAIQHPENYSLTAFEQYRYEWCNSMGDNSCYTQNERFPKFEDWKKSKGLE